MKLYQNGLFEKIKHHRVVAWDVDGVLLGHSRSPDFHKLITENPFDQEHVVVTFRTHGLQPLIFQDLNNHYRETAPQEKHFQNVMCCPGDLWQSVFQTQKVNPLDLTEYRHWKGHACHGQMADVLIEDDFYHTELGCRYYDIDLIHPDDFL